MAEFFLDGFTEAFRELVDALNEISDDARPEYENAISEWLRAVSDDARRILGRPGWLLANAIERKFKRYANDRKLWAMTGISRESKKPNDPGVYGRYHESGYFDPKTGRFKMEPKFFLRGAKLRNAARLEKSLEKINEIVWEKIRSRVKNVSKIQYH